jgi:hypothetical protein
MSLKSTDILEELEDLGAKMPVSEIPKFIDHAN